MVSDVFLEQLRNACPLEEIARTYVDLKRRGRTYVCNCPFHSEKTPSFTVFPDTQSFYCFGCGAGGDVITFIQQIENLDFMDAVKLLAQNSGMTVPEQGADEKQSRMRKRILAVNRAAANFYYRMLTGSDKRGLQYFIQRRLTTTTIKKYGLGFAPETWDALSRYLLQQGFTEEELLLADVSRRSRRGTLIDTFRNRVIFPIVDLRGNVIGFGGRVLDDSQPKYLNTAQTPVFDKGKNLFSLQFAKNSVTTTLILAEGYMDVIAVHQAGFENVVATLGTAITPDQARKISQYAKTVIIAYDSDAAGQAATQKAMRHFSEVGIETKILRMQGAKDPDEYIRKFGAERFRMLLEGSEDAINFQLDRCEMGLDLQTENGRATLLRRFDSDSRPCDKRSLPDANCRKMSYIGRCFACEHQSKAEKSAEDAEEKGIQQSGCTYGDSTANRSRCQRNGRQFPNGASTGTIALLFPVTAGADFQTGRPFAAGTVYRSILSEAVSTVAGAPTTGIRWLDFRSGNAADTAGNGNGEPSAQFKTDLSNQSAGGAGLYSAAANPFGAGVGFRCSPFGTGCTEKEEESSMAMMRHCPPWKGTRNHGRKNDH